MSIKIQITDKVAVNLTPEEVIVCGNSGYEVEFLFDAEWASEAVKTARFVYRKGGQNYFDDVVFSGTTVKAPVLVGINYVLVGVYAGDLITSTPAVVECDKSILCGSGTHDEPTPDVYNQLIELINAGGGGGSVELDTTLTQSGKAADAKAVGDALANVGGGLSATAKNLLLTILRAAFYSSDQTSNIAALELALGSGGSGGDSGGDDTGGGEDDNEQTTILAIDNDAYAVQRNKVLCIVPGGDADVEADGDVLSIGGGVLVHKQTDTLTIY